MLHSPHFLTSTSEMWSAVGLGVVTLLTAIWFGHRWWMNTEVKHANLPPGSMGLPFIGEAFHLITPGYSLDLHPFVKTRLQRYGAVFKTSIAGHPVVISADPEVNNHIMLQEGKSVEMRYPEAYNKMFNDDETRINASGFIHRYVRGKTLARFGSQRLQETLLPLIEATVHKTLKSWSGEESIDVKKETAKMVLDFTAKQIFGYDPDASSVNLSDKFSNFLGCLLTLPLNVPGTKYYNCMKDHKFIMNMLKQIVKERLAARKRSEEDGDLLDSAVKDIGTEKLLTEELVVYLLLGLLVASYDSVSMTVALAFKLLSENPAVLEELTVENEEIVNSRIDKDSSLTWEDYKSMMFTRHVINETLRVGPIVPGLLRRALQDIEVKGYKIPAGWSVMVVTAARHYNPEAFAEPNKFNPSRWKELDSSVISKNFMPFGGGTRQCAGAEYSKAFMAVFFHKLLTEYRWEKVRGGDVIRNPLLGFKDGIHIKVSVNP